MAAWLARAGHDVSAVARGAALDAIRRDGLRVRNKGATESFRIRADSDPAGLGPQDYVLVTVKAQSLGAVADGIAPLLGKPPEEIQSSVSLLGYREALQMLAQHGFGVRCAGHPGGPDGLPVTVRSLRRSR